ncbi:MAG TPA: Tex family protein [Bacteroidia bacterium]|nr:Tex family protein [Bacteroidia bacterium]
MPSQKEYVQLIAHQLQIGWKQVQTTIDLLDEGGTTPFIARYRKEATGALDEVKIEHIRLQKIKYEELLKRKTFILQNIQELGKLTEVLKQQINSCWELNLLEDLYLPYKAKRKTKASIAREKGLEPLALWLLKETYSEVNSEAKRFLNNDVGSTDEALQGARDIIAEIINEDIGGRNILRNQFQKFAILSSKVAKWKELEGAKYRDYFSFQENLLKMPSHRLLAVLRGEEEGYLKLNIEPEEQIAIQKLVEHFIKRNNDSSKQLSLAIKDAYKRLLSPSLEIEFRNLAKSKADEEAIKVFAENLRQLLLAAPLGNKRILAIDPGFKSGCKVVCLSQEGNLIIDDVIYPHEPQCNIIQAAQRIKELLQNHNIEAIAIGNGTAGRETEIFINSLAIDSKIEVYMINENGASVYSASAVAREEFPDKDVTVRGAVSIGRRLADPLAELVKIDAKSIGVGQYQHDVDQQKLKQSLDTVVQSCVNLVGVNLNTASKSLLTYVAGLNEQTAQNIINYRNENGAFKSRMELKKVPRLGPKTFEQCAGFLRITGGHHILDATAVHPESYPVVEKMAKLNNAEIGDLISNSDFRKKIKPEDFVDSFTGLYTIIDILKELEKPGRDPREKISQFKFSDAKKPEDLFIGMILPGIVSNITKFGCFVDIGVKQDGLVHISQLADKFIDDPNKVVKLNQQVMVKVTEIDLSRKRIGLTMKF